MLFESFIIIHNPFAADKEKLKRKLIAVKLNMSQYNKITEKNTVFCKTIKNYIYT